MAEAGYIEEDALREDIDELTQNLQTETLKREYEEALQGRR